ncbi:hypothetical protein [Pedobacter sp. GR22-10]|uniref:hypothetical protein n=1 Tax=Pedobacter sp. GR22-10 TaxID=2994472 RepID=UPI0022454480|nr:hypothetical protein [Pedobacter sp. GR22-10]MCX2432194.1 hypothetical protein [Pedobacter sp. GR22-10]
MMEFEGEGIEKKTFLKVEVEGQKASVWESAKGKLMDLMTKLMDAQINSYSDSTVREELKRAGSNVIEFANAKLQRPSLENIKLQAEIELMLKNSAKVDAETRKVNAEAEAVELANLEQKLKIVMGAAKMIAMGERNQEAILFCKDMESLLGQFTNSNLLEKGEDLNI